MPSLCGHFFYIIKLGSLNYVFKGPKGMGTLTHILVCINEETKEHALEPLDCMVDSNDGGAIKAAIEKDGRKPSYFSAETYSQAKTAIYVFEPNALILDRLNLTV